MILRSKSWRPRNVCVSQPSTWLWEVSKNETMKCGSHSLPNSPAAPATPARFGLSCPGWPSANVLGHRKGTKVLLPVSAKPAPFLQAVQELSRSLCSWKPEPTSRAAARLLLSSQVGTVRAGWGAQRCPPQTPALSSAWGRTRQETAKTEPVTGAWSLSPCLEGLFNIQKEVNGHFLAFWDWLYHSFSSFRSHMKLSIQWSSLACEAFNTFPRVFA